MNFGLNSERRYEPLPLSPVLLSATSQRATDISNSKLPNFY